MKTYAQFGSGHNAGDAFAAILKHNLDNLHAWEHKARDWTDIEGVHQLRVSFRRLRSALSIFRPIIAREHRRYWSQAIKALVDQTGMARDIDVLIDEGLPAFHDERPDAAEIGNGLMLKVLYPWRVAAYEHVRTMCDSPAFSAFSTEFARWVDVGGWRCEELPGKKRKRLDQEVTVLATHLLDKHDGVVRRLGSDADWDSPSDMHRLRIECKKLRYAGEFFFVLFSRMDAFLHHIKGLQDTLGIMHDAAVVRAMMEAIIPAEASSELRRYALDLVEWRAEQYASEEAHLEVRWADFLEADRPWRGYEPRANRRHHGGPHPTRKGGSPRGGRAPKGMGASY